MTIDDILDNLDTKSESITTTKTVVEKEVKTYTEAGKGRKYCPQCKQYVGARSFICACGFEFDGKTHREEDLPLTLEQQQERAYIDKYGCGLVRSVVYCPAGKCKINLPLCADSDENDIYDWCDAVVDEGLKNKKLYYTTALIQFLRTFVDVNDPKFTKLKQFIINWSNN